MAIFDDSSDKIRNEIEKILSDLKRSVGDIISAAVVGDTGLPIAFTVQHGNETKVSAMTAAQLSLAETTISEMGLGLYEQLFIQGSDGYFIITKISEIALLTIATNRHIKLGLLFLDCRRASEKISKLM